MNNVLLKLMVKFQGLTCSQEGQDLVEYALLTTMVSLALITAISSIATAVNGAFNRISTTLV